MAEELKVGDEVAIRARVAEVLRGGQVAVITDTAEVPGFPDGFSQRIVVQHPNVLEKLS